jgi:hypothetical protein
MLERRSRCSKLNRELVVSVIDFKSFGFMADPLVPVQVTFALFALKAVEFSALLSRGIAKAKTNGEKYDLITAAYQGDLKFLRLLVWLRPGIMIVTALLLAVVTIWFDLTIYNYYSPGSLISPIIAKTDADALAISITALLIGVLVYVFTSFSWAKFYTSFRFVLSKSQYQQRLASRIDRETDGYFYIDNEQSEKIARRLVEAVLEDPSWYKQSIVHTPDALNELKSAEYANFLFFGEFVEAKAAAGEAMERWGWITDVYKAQPDLFSVAKLKQLNEKTKFAATLVDEMKKHSLSPEAFGTGLVEVLNDGIAKLGKRFEYDARKIGQMNFWNCLLIAVRRRTRYEVVDKRLTKFEPYKRRSGNRLVLIKLMISRNLWDIPVKELEFPFSPWQCVFLLRSKIISTDLEKFSTHDPDFAWFRNAALRKLTSLVQASIDTLRKTKKEEMKRILKSELTPSSAMLLTDTFLWGVGSKCCRFNKCGEEKSEKGITYAYDIFLGSWIVTYGETRKERMICPFSSLAICNLDEGKKLFYYEAPNFEQR